MRTTEDLRRELRDQAEESRGRSLPEVELPARRTPRAARRPALRTTGLVLAAAAAVSAVVLLPSLVADRGEDPRATVRPSAGPSPSPTPSLDPGPSQDWEAVRPCLAISPECIAARVIRAGDVELAREGLASVRTRTPGEGVRTTYSSERRGAHEGVQVLVGRVGGGADSRLTYRVGDGPHRVLPAGRPSLVAVPDDLGPRVRVTLEERGRPLPDEQLLVAFYAPVR